MDIQEIKDTLKEAIENHVVIELAINNQPGIRKVHPYYFGVNDNSEQLHAYQLAGQSTTAQPIGWKDIPLETIHSINLTNKIFISADAGYNPNSKYDSIECQVKLNTVK